jgi:hypothetical protein
VVAVIGGLTFALTGERHREYRRIGEGDQLGKRGDPQGSYRRMQRRCDNSSFLLIFGSIVLTTILLVMIAKGFHWF